MLRSGITAALTGLALLAGSTSGAGAGLSATPEKAAATTTPLTPIRVGYIPIAECAPLYVGLAKGYFAKEGLDVRIEPMRGGAAILPAVQTGDLELGFSNVVSLVGMNVGRSPNSPKWLVSVVSASYEKPDARNHALLTRRGETVKLADVASGRSAIALNTMRNIEELMLRRYLEKKGFPNAKPRVVPLGFPEMIAALGRREVDVVSVVEPFIEPPLRTGQASLLDHQYLAVSKSTLVATYVATAHWLEQNADVAHRFAVAMDAATEFVATNEAEMRQILESYTRIRREDLAVAGMPSFAKQPSAADLHETAKEMMRFDFIKEIPPAEAMVWKRPSAR